MDKKRYSIGILTFSRSVNYGAFLQCFSLYKQISKIAENVKIINYNLFQAEIGFFIQSLLRGLIKGLKQYYVIRKYLKTELNLTKRKISCNYQKSIDYINSLDFNLIIAGSDEIWKINSFRQYPNVYWTTKALNAKKISYGASANRTHTKKLTPEVIADMKGELQNYAYLGVRDDHTYQLLTEFDLGKKINLNCDPTFVYEFVKTPDLREKLVSQYHLDLNKPIIGLLTGNKNVGKLTKDVFGKDYQIVSITCSNSYADYWLYDLNPFEWANVFKYFTGCVSSYFHGVIFSILNDVPFVAFDSEKYSLSYQTKIMDIIKRSGLNQCYVNILEEPIENISVRLENNINNRNSLINVYEDLRRIEKEKWALFEEEFRQMIKKDWDESK